MKLTKDKQGFDEMDQLLINILKTHKENGSILTAELLQEYRKNLMSFIFNVNR